MRKARNVLIMYLWVSPSLAFFFDLSYSLFSLCLLSFCSLSIYVRLCPSLSLLISLCFFLCQWLSASLSLTLTINFHSPHPNIHDSSINEMNWTETNFNDLKWPFLNGTKAKRWAHRTKRSSPPMQMAPAWQAYASTAWTSKAPSHHVSAYWQSSLLCPLVATTSSAVPSRRAIATSPTSPPSLSSTQR